MTLPVARDLSSSRAWALDVVDDAHRAARATIDQLETIAAGIRALADDVAWQSPAAEAFHARTHEAGAATRRLTADIDAACRDLSVLRSRVRGLAP